ncbi:hypothetical protein ACFE04_004368 [Oxalis oulophora]
MQNSERSSSCWGEICCFGYTCVQLFFTRVILCKWLNITHSHYSADSDDDFDDHPYSDYHTQDTSPTLTTRDSETSTAEDVINSKEIRICVGSWNVAGILPPDDLRIHNWIDIDHPADVYVLGFQEIVPLNAANIFGPEDNRPVTKWENIIRETLNRIQLKPTKIKCHPSLSNFKPSEDVTNLEEILLESDNDIGGKLSGESIGLSRPKPPLNSVSQYALENPKLSKAFGIYNPLTTNDLDIEKSSYVRILSKQMVGIFLTIWVRRGLHRHIQNVKVSTVGVGIMGYFGNKGSISVSMSIYQTLFCCICTHLTSGEKEGHQLKRNADVQEIHRRTLFHSMSGIGHPRSNYDHDRIIWLGDLNYRINLPYEMTKQLISEQRWSKLLHHDQLAQELRKGHVFDGWSEDTINFAPTYKYEMNSEKYYGEDPKAGRRNPAWCDRILSYGNGIKQLSYTRSELNISDHRPVTATYMAEVDVISPKKLQQDLTFTDANIENEHALLLSNDALPDGTRYLDMAHYRIQNEKS